MTRLVRQPLKKHDEQDKKISKLLCVNCRRSGHARKNCPVEWPGEAAYQYWAHSSSRSQIINQLTKDCGSGLCNRCQELDILSMFSGELWWKTTSDLDVEQIKNDQHHRSLGSVGTTEFLADCPLCICLFALTPNPINQTDELHIIADWAIHRVERLAHIEPETRGLYDICVMVQACSPQGSLDLSEHDGDALCLMDEHESSQRPPLGGQLVDRSRLNIDLIQQYISTCAKLHPYTCLPRQSDKLEAIKLIDVESRTIIPYPGHLCEYLALSYVWGEVDAFRYVKDEKLGDIPKTIEDAMTLTSLLGKKYLWVDLLCIDQYDDGERQRQIQMMSDIYGGAFASIIAMSGATMESGLPRMPGSDREGQPQLSCKIQGEQLVGLMPTLSKQIHSCKWGTRAWTLQEAVLSPRCLYITDHQVYYECNAMQCCESLDERCSWIHQSFRDHRAIKSDPHGYIHGHGTLRKTFDGEGKPKDHLEIYGTLTALYSIRDMTDPNDIINAYSGIMQHLTKLAYPEGFFWGLPIPEFNWGLLWWHPSRFAHQPGNFPAWSWTGWRGQVYPEYPIDVQVTQGFSTHLVATGVVDGKPKQIWPLESPQSDQKASHQSNSQLFDEETIFDRIESLPLQNNIDLADYNLEKAEQNGHLLLECALCDLELTYIKPHTYWYNPPAEFYNVTVNGVPCILKTTPGDFECEIGQTTTISNLALIVRDKGVGMVAHYFLQVYFDSEDECEPYGSRTGRTYELVVSEDGVEVFGGFSVERTRIILT